MTEKMYNTYSFGDDLTLFEIDRKTIKNKDYLLLLQKQEPNLIVVGFFEEGKLQIVVNKVMSAELLKSFTSDKKAFFEKLKPFIILPTKKIVGA